jgi:hypothetical protein
MSNRYKTLFHKNSDILTAVTTPSYSILLLIAKRRKEIFSDVEELIRPSLETVTARLDDKTAEAGCILNIPPSDCSDC